ncbi:hypothetical protein [Romboutsia lituseburensis]|uniref:hypothetical protein n=1 Tax=Romboutsia lituseburensis TaxID=1537 RepID=UPI0022EAA65C|nr:hypothetical protein [Romboutsia lituseburensis]
MNAKDPLMELKRKQFKNDYQKIENNSKNGEKLNINGIDYRVESMNAYFEESVLELRLKHIGEPSKCKHKKEFKAGDKVKLNHPMNYSMEKQVPYKKYYDVVVTDTMGYAGNELQILGIDGVKGMVSAEYFDLYIENQDRDFTLDELVFMQGHLTWVQEDIEDRFKEGLYERKDIAIRKINTLKEINKKIRKLFDTY